MRCVCHDGLSPTKGDRQKRCEICAGTGTLPPALEPVFANTVAFLEGRAAELEESGRVTAPPRSVSEGVVLTPPGLRPNPDGRGYFDELDPAMFRRQHREMP